MREGIAILQRHDGGQHAAPTAKQRLTRRFTPGVRASATRGVRAPARHIAARDTGCARTRHAALASLAEVLAATRHQGAVAPADKTGPVRLMAAAHTRESRGPSAALPRAAPMRRPFAAGVSTGESSSTSTSVSDSVSQSGKSRKIRRAIRSMAVPAPLAMNG